ncbi:hypothetical protein B9T31_13260 [Acinetobacter sp. ANC 4558]|nr:hypothetical protein B9T31_13260 [Acinetobacter sp. ANC 4558]
MFKRNNKNVNHNKYMNGPDIIYRSSDIIVHIIMTILMMVVFILLCFFVFREGVDNLLLNGTLNILLLLFTVIEDFLLVIFGFAMIFPIYINEYGALFRTLFLKKKFLN